MSLIIFKDQKSRDKFNQLLLNDTIEKQHHNSDSGIVSHNTCECCAVCFKGPSVDNETNIIEPFIKHHVTYFPQKIAYVHDKCHKKIHATDNHYLIQYDEGDGRKFYDNLKSLSKINQGSMYQ
jgi:hypothetical protein